MKATGGFVVVCLVCLLLAGCAQQHTAIVDPGRLRMFEPLPESQATQAASPWAERIALGRMLYYDARLSKSQNIACNNCHKLDAYGVDSQVTSEGHKGQRGTRNSPTVYNAAAQVAQFWDGRAKSLEEQAKGPVLNPAEMAMPGEKEVVAVLKSMPEYVQAFKTAFPESKDPVTYENMAIAIGSFERGLLTPARWDKFLKGDQAALTPEEKAGFNTFSEAGCVTCHSGAYLGGNLFQRLGVAKAYPDTADQGRFHVTNNDADRMMFKVPSLRNVEKTGPYFHNGKVPNLEAAVARMAEYQLGKPMDEVQIKSIVTWMKSLTGEIPAEYIKKPELPKSTAATPKPESAD